MKYIDKSNMFKLVQNLSKWFWQFKTCSNLFKICQNGFGNLKHVQTCSKFVKMVLAI